jgi:hypothetical protein
MSKRARRVVLVLGAFLAAPILSSAAMAGVQVGISLNVPLPAGVHLTVGNVAPYYVGRVYYPPLAVWRPVYSFPVQTPYGMIYRPYVYDGAGYVTHGYIPGPAVGYGAFVVDGHGYYNPGWYHGHGHAHRHWH